MDRLTVPAAAERLGVSENALRKRIQRDTIEWEHGEDGRVYVYLSPDEPPTMTGHACDQAADQTMLIARLENEVEYLRREAEDWKEEARRKDAIIMTMAQRIPELEPARESPSEPPESPETASAGAEGVETPLQQKHRSWWRRFFGV
jgi:hypothetical protein